MQTQKTTDYAARIEALNPQGSYILQAPAGSGKTKILIDRYLTLLTRVEKPEEIIAITFTRKAASEMKERVLTALLYPRALPTHTNVLVDKVLARNEKLNWGLTQNIHRFRILTIDALAYSLAQQFPHFFELGQSSTITENPDYYYQIAVNNIWLNVQSSFDDVKSKLKTILLYFNNRLDTLTGLLVEILKSREQWLYPIVSHLDDPERLKKAVEMSLQNVVLETLQLTDAVFPCSIKKSLWSVIESVSYRFSSDHPLRQAGMSWAVFPAVSLDTLSLWRAIGNFLLTKQGKFKKRLDKKMGFSTETPPDNCDQNLKKEMKSILDQLRSNTLLESRLKSIIELPEIQYASSQWKVIHALIEILPLLVSELNLVFQKYRVLDFIEINLSALRALGSLENPTDLALYLDYKIQHILVDEFQDTSLIHFHLLEKILEGWQKNDGRTLFLVGDPMQSIYRFRQAEVGLFLKAQQQGLGQLSLKPLTLNTNFRASATLVEWINKNFRTIFPSQDELTMGSIAYRPFTTIDRGDNAKSGVHCHAFEQNNLTTKLNAIVELVQHYQREDSNTTIAILVRSRRQVVQLLPHLQAKQVDYQATELQSFSKNLVIRDLTTLLQALLFPHDRLAWFALLRTPWCGLSLNDLLTIAKKLNSEKEKTIWQTLQNISLIDISKDGKIRLNKVVSILYASFRSRFQLSLSDWIRLTWLSMGGPLTLRGETDVLNVQYWFDLISRLDQETESFSLKKLKSCMEGRYINTGASNSHVHVMTIHKSKGLEFDQVILPELNQMLPGEKDRLLQFLSKPRLTSGEDFIMAPMPYAESKTQLNIYLRKIEAEKSWYEAQRLLYVAITRAKKNVHLMARLNFKNNQLKFPVKRSFLGMLWSLNQEQFMLSLQPNSSVASINIKPLVYQRLPLTYFQDKREIKDSSELNLFLKPLQQKDSTVNTVSWTMPNEFSRIVGIVMHEILQRIGEMGIEQWTLKQWDKQIPFYQRRLRQWQLNTSEIIDAINLINASMKDLIKDSNARWLLSNKHRSIQQEYALSAQSNGQLVNIIIDRTFIDHENVRWIIDYKTVLYTDNISTKLDQYKSQLTLYQSVMEKFDTVHAIKLGVYFPMDCRWLTF